ncbi:hypothetical protein C0Q70_02840 [Pomacea canaliculata]|uniref:SRCR domain-containing protein n=1 Tax=Pomacea canaliculata TaxID=400727 RepID=A0A2T7PR15_POMCA|nr:hypothetical protein C0Q70_02840 [Pomacea canaliculata]
MVSLDRMAERIRLTGGRTEHEGRLELLTNGQWRSVCEDGWTHQDAKLVCTILGNPGDAVAAVGRDVFGVGTDSDACAANPAGLICSGFESYPVRLVNGSHANEGRVEIQINGEWGSVCHSNWDVNDASVVCRMMGYTGRPVPVGQAMFGEGSDQVWARDLQCIGTEKHLLHCPALYPAGYRSKCTHNMDAGVICPNFHYYPIRLQNGSTFAEGRVEIHMFHQWATINSLNWDDKDAAVICRMLGHSSAGAQAVRNAHFGEGTDGAPLLSDLSCTGEEEHILQCPSSRVIGVTGYPHSQDAGVICRQCMT